MAPFGACAYRRAAARNSAASDLPSPFAHRSSYDLDFARYTSGQGPTRTDHIYDVQGELSYPLTSWARISARGQYTSAESNVDVFDYDRWIAGGYLTLTWGHTL